MKSVINFVFSGTHRYASLMIALVFCGISGFSQNLSPSQVPSKAVSSLKSSFPGSNPVWSSGPGGSFEANFSSGGKEMIYTYDQGGNLQQKKLKTSLSSLPASVGSSVSAGYPTQLVTGAYKVIARNGKYFEVYVENQNQLDRLRYDVQGNAIGKSSTPLSSAHNTLAMSNQGTAGTMRGDVDLLDDEMEDEDIRDLFDDDPLFNGSSDIDSDIPGFNDDADDMGNWDSVDKLLEDEEDDDDDRDLINDLNKNQEWDEIPEDDGGSNYMDDGMDDDGL